MYIDADHTWRFDSDSQTTAPNQIDETIGFAGGVAMDFSRWLVEGDSISSITTSSVADIADNAEPTISASAVSSDKTKAELTLTTASADPNTYTFTVKVATVNGETIVRKGRLVLE
jgi:hypothetical protein